MEICSIDAKNMQVNYKSQGDLERKGASGSGGFGLDGRFTWLDCARARKCGRPWRISSQSRMRCEDRKFPVSDVHSPLDAETHEFADDMVSLEFTNFDMLQPQICQARRVMIDFKIFCRNWTLRFLIFIFFRKFGGKKWRSVS